MSHVEKSFILEIEVTATAKINKENVGEDLDGNRGVLTEFVDDIEFDKKVVIDKILDELAQEDWSLE